MLYYWLHLCLAKFQFLQCLILFFCFVFDLFCFFLLVASSFPFIPTTWIKWIEQNPLFWTTIPMNLCASMWPQTSGCMLLAVASVGCQGEDGSHLFNREINSHCISLKHICHIYTHRQRLTGRSAITTGEFTEQNCAEDHANEQNIYSQPTRIKWKHISD